MTKDELQKILDDHLHWLNKDCVGWENMRADLSEASLCRADLHEANLYGAILCGAKLCRADLRYVDLRYADLHEANLCGADLCGADLCGADLCGADLCGADLCGADLRDVNLREANLSEANLSCAYLLNANLSEANLEEADLGYAELSGAELKDANLRGSKNLPFVPFSCPDYGSFTAFKKAYCFFGTPVIVMLEIPEDAKRLSATGRKCRCDKAKVLEIQNLDGTKADTDVAFSGADKNFKYRIGETVTVDDFDDDRWHDCSAGIHFFINRQEAVEY